jgi:hypothetical protein
MQQPQSQFRNTISQEETQPLPVPTLSPDFTPMPAPLTEEKPSPLIRLTFLSKKRLTRIVASVLTLLLAGAIFVVWFGAPSTSSSSPLPNVSVT